MLITLIVVAVIGPDLFDLIGRAASKAGVSMKELAYAQGISPAQWCHQIKGEHNQHVSLARLSRTPQPFRAALLEELFTEWGAEKPLTARDVLALVRPVMARLQLGYQEERCA